MKKLISVLLLAVLCFSMGTLTEKADVCAAGKPAHYWGAGSYERFGQDAVPAKASITAGEDEYYITITSYDYKDDSDKYIEIPMKSTYQLKWETNAPSDAVSFSSDSPDIVSVSSKGKITAKMVDYDSSTVSATVQKPEGGTAEDFLYVYTDFIDVCDPNAFFYDPVYWALDYGITSGFTDSHGNLTGYFKPNTTCTRGQIATFMYRYFRQYFTVDISEIPDFSDVKKGSYYYEAVRWAVAAGITTGYTDKNGKPTGKFGPDDSCTRAQVVTFIYRMLSDVWPADTSDVADFSDVKKDTYYYDAVRWAVAHEITTGYSDSSGNPSGKFGPNDKCTRGQVVTFLYRTW